MRKKKVETENQNETEQQDAREETTQIPTAEQTTTEEKVHEESPREQEIKPKQLSNGSIQVTFCPHCGRQINLGENPCRHCGGLVGYPELMDNPEWMVCPNCNYTEPARFFTGTCKHCGYPKNGGNNAG